MLPDTCRVFTSQNVLTLGRVWRPHSGPHAEIFAVLGVGSCMDAAAYFRIN